MGKRNKPRATSPLSPLVDIVVTTAGRFDCLEKCLTALENQTFKQFKVFILDNASPAEERIGHQNLFEGWDFEFETKRLTQNIGFPSGANEASRMGNSPLILFLSDDVELEPNTLDILVRRMDDASIGICGAKLLFPEDSAIPGRPAGKVQHVGLAVNIRGEVTHPLIGWDKNDPKTNISKECFAVTGACLMVRRKLFEKKGGFDTVFGSGTWEDCDLAMSVRQFGGRIYIDTQAIAHHYVGATIEKRPEFAYDLRGNQQIFQTKWLKTGLINYDQLNGEWSYY